MIECVPENQINAKGDLDTGVKFFSTKQKEQQQQQNLNSDNLT